MSTFVSPPTFNLTSSTYNHTSSLYILVSLHLSHPYPLLLLRVETGYSRTRACTAFSPLPSAPVALLAAQLPLLVNQLSCIMDSSRLRPNTAWSSLAPSFLLDRDRRVHRSQPWRETWSSNCCKHCRSDETGSSVVGSCGWRERCRLPSDRYDFIVAYIS